MRLRQQCVSCASSSRNGGGGGGGGGGPCSGLQGQGRRELARAPLMVPIGMGAVDINTVHRHGEIISLSYIGL